MASIPTGGAPRRRRGAAGGGRQDGRPARDHARPATSAQRSRRPHARRAVGRAPDGAGRPRPGGPLAGRGSGLLQRRRPRRVRFPARSGHGPPRPVGPQPRQRRARAGRPDHRRAARRLLRFGDRAARFAGRVVATPAPRCSSPGRARSDPGRRVARSACPAASGVIARCCWPCPVERSTRRPRSSGGWWTRSHLRRPSTIGGWNDSSDEPRSSPAAASGIGLAVAEAFVAEGMRVVMADIDEESLQVARRPAHRAGAEVQAVVGGRP